MALYTPADPTSPRVCARGGERRAPRPPTRPTRLHPARTRKTLPDEGNPWLTAIAHRAYGAAARQRTEAPSHRPPARGAHHRCDRDRAQLRRNRNTSDEQGARRGKTATYSRMTSPARSGDDPAVLGVSERPARARAVGARPAKPLYRTFRPATWLKTGSR